MPEKILSNPVNATATGTMLQPLVFGAGATTPDTIGAVLSMLSPLAVTAALTLPALSVHVPGEEDCAAPSADNV